MPTGTIRESRSLGPHPSLRPGASRGWTRSLPVVSARCNSSSARVTHIDRLESSRRRSRTLRATLLAIASVLWLTSFTAPLSLLSVGAMPPQAGFVLALVVTTVAMVTIGGATRSAIGGRWPDRRDARERLFVHLLHDAIRRGDSPKARAIVLDDDSVSAVAFASGFNRYIGITTGALRRLDRSELAAVVAHECAHLAHGDATFATLTTAALRAMLWLRRGMKWATAAIAVVFGIGAWRTMSKKGSWLTPLVALVFLVLAAVAWVFVGILYGLVVLAVCAAHRQSEYAADARAAQITGDPHALVRALQKAERSRAPRWLRRDPALRALALVSPVDQSFLATLTATHPTTEARISRLLGSKATRDPYGRVRVRVRSPHSAWGRDA